MIHYDFVVVHEESLEAMMEALNRCEDKIIAVTQCGNTYTIFYEAYGNAEKSEGG